jgi:hypothetical protein
MCILSVQLYYIQDIEDEIRYQGRIILDTMCVHTELE